MNVLLKNLSLKIIAQKKLKSTARMLMAPLKGRDLLKLTLFSFVEELLLIF